MQSHMHNHILQQNVHYITAPLKKSLFIKTFSTAQEQTWPDLTFDPKLTMQRQQM